MKKTKIYKEIDVIKIPIVLQGNRVKLPGRFECDL